MSGSSYFIYQDCPWGLCDKVTAYQALWCPSEGNSNWWDHLKISYLTKLEPSLRGSSSGGGILPEPDHTYYKLTITGFFSLSLPLLSLSIPALPRHSPKHQIQGSHFWCGLGVPSLMVHYLPKAWCASKTRLNVVKQNPSSTNLLWTWCIIYDGSLFEKGLLYLFGKVRQLNFFNLGFIAFGYSSFM